MVAFRPNADPGVGGWRKTWVRCPRAGSAWVEAGVWRWVKFQLTLLKENNSMLLKVRLRVMPVHGPLVLR